MAPAKVAPPLKVMPYSRLFFTTNALCGERPSLFVKLWMIVNPVPSVPIRNTAPELSVPPAVVTPYRVLLS